MTPPAHFQVSSPACTGSDSGGSRSRIHVGRARRRSRLLHGWSARLTSETAEAGEKPSGPSQGRVSRTLVPCTGACWRPEALERPNQCCRMTPTTAQADHY